MPPRKGRLSFLRVAKDEMQWQRYEAALTLFRALSAFEPDMGGKWLGVLKEAAPQRGRRVSQLSETLPASVAKKRERLEQVKALTRYGKRHPRIQPKNTP